MSLSIKKTQLICPFCKDNLTHFGSIELEIPDRDASIYTYQCFKCEKCNKHVYGELEEFINVFDDDLIHIGYEADPEEWLLKLNSMKKCNDLHDKKCNCITHANLKENGFKGKIRQVPLDLLNS